MKTFYQRMKLRVDIFARAQGGKKEQILCITKILVGHGQHTLLTATPRCRNALNVHVCSLAARKSGTNPFSSFRSHVTPIGSFEDRFSGAIPLPSHPGVRGPDSDTHLTFCDATPIRNSRLH